MLFSRAPEPYTVRINTSSGTIDGVRSEAFIGHAFHFESITIEEGVTLIAEGDRPLTLLATGDVRIDGHLISDGRSAEDAGAVPGRNGNSGSAGGRGGPGGDRGGDGGGTTPGSRSVDGRRGGGPGGGSGGRLSGGRSASGAGGGFAARVVDSGATRGGSPYGNPEINPLFGGSGGGGGGIRDGSPLADKVLGPGDSGGGGGGGGGGAVRITAGGDIIVTSTGRISANGGDGGRGKDGVAGHGGGGSGGAVLLQAYGEITIEPGAVVSAVGGSGSGDGSNTPGGDGGNGRIRFEDSDGVVENSGVAMPEPTLGELSGETRKPPPEPPAGRQHPGDFDQDGKLTISDAVGMLQFLFAGDSRSLPCVGVELSEGGNLLVLDLNGDGGVNLSDAVHILRFLFVDGPPPTLGTDCVPVPGCPEICTG